MPVHASPESFDRLVAEHRAGVFRICRSILRDDHLGADAAQEAFLRLWRRLGDGRWPEHVAPWLKKAAVSAALDLARRRRVREDAGRELLRGAEPGDLQTGEDGPAAAESSELRRALARGLRELSEGQRTVFLLRHEGGLTLAEVAGVLGVALPTAKTQFARACLRLQTHLRAFRNDPESQR